MNEYDEDRIIEEMVCDSTSHPDLRADPVIDRMVRETRNRLGLERIIDMRKSLSEILNGANKDTIESAWGDTQAAADFVPLPKGEYDAVVTHGELFTARTGTPGYKLTFEVCEGDFKGRKFWHDLWLTPAALPFTKRDLAKIGIAKLEQLEKPLPARFVCKVKLALRKNDEGTDYNRVTAFECTGTEQDEPFAPASGSGA